MATRKTSFWFAASAFACAPALFGAQVLKKSVDFTIAADGSVHERFSLAVRLDAARDLDAWSPYGVSLDENRELHRLDAWVEEPGGKRRELSRKDFDWSQPVDLSLLHISARTRLIRFPEASAGAVLRLEYEIDERPYFPALRVDLAEASGRAAVDDLKVCVHGAGKLRFTLGGDAGLLHADAARGQICVSGGLPRREELERAPAAWRNGPVLDVAWDDAGTWAGLGVWFEGLLRAVPRDDAAVRAQTRTLLAGVSETAAEPAAERRARLSALLRFVRQSVRYVGVEVGIGGYRPQAAAAVLSQRWGDCKGKALLLIDLLREAGITAYPVLIEASASESPDPAFPTPSGFNHMIVGVASQGIARPGDAVADGVLFVDPTLEEGGIEWLDPATQGQPALIVDGAASRLVTTPVEASTRRLESAIDVTVDAAGTARGKVTIDLHGAWAAPILHLMSAASQEDLVRRSTALLEAFLPGASFHGLTWSHEDGEQPRAGWTAEMVLPGFAAVQPGARSALLTNGAATPSTELLDQRRAPILLESGAQSATWAVHLPPGWCAPAEDAISTSNELGTFAQTVRRLDQGFVLERSIELRRREAAPEQFAALRELALAEHRANRRRVRMDCQP